MSRTKTAVVLGEETVFGEHVTDMEVVGWCALPAVAYGAASRLLMKVRRVRASLLPAFELSG